MSSKLALPPLRAGLVERPRLWPRSLAPLTVIHAPAGYGKTTLAMQLLARHAGPRAWLTLDRLDNDPRRFWSHVVGAVRAVLPEAAAEAGELLDAGESFRIADILTLFVNDVADAERAHGDAGLALVLDDLHCIASPAIVDDLNLFIDCAPAALHVIVTSRVRPDLRIEHRAARRGVHEIGPAQLAFTGLETEQLLGSGGRDGPGAQACAELASHTGGWVSAIKLLALAGPDAQAVAGSRSERVGRLNRYVMDEVLRTLEADTLLLVRAAALFEQFSAALLDALLARSGAAAGIAELQRLNLFVEALPEHDGQFRFHEVFRDCVLERCAWGSDDERRLREAAADWLRAHGQPDAALAELQRLRAWSQVVALLEAEGPQWLRHGLHDKLRAALAALPAEERERRPRLMCLAVWLMTDGDKHVEGDRLMRRAQALIAADPALQADHALQCEVLSLAAVVERLKGDFAAMHHAATESLRHAEAGRLDMRWRSHLTLGAFEFSLGMLESATANLRLARKYAVIEDHKYGLALSTGYLCEALYQVGALDEAQRTAEHTCEHLGGTAFARLPIGDWRFIGLPEVLRERGRLEEAAALLDRLAALGRQDHAEMLIALVVLVRLWTLALTAGRYDSARALVDEIEALHLRMRFASPYPIGTLDGLRARIDLLGGEPERALAWARAAAPGLSAAPGFASHQDVLTAVRVFVVHGDADAARSLASALLARAEAGGWRAARARALLLRGLAHRCAGEGAAAEADFAASLDGLLDSGYRSLYADERPVLLSLGGLLTAGSGPATAVLLQACGITGGAPVGAAAPSADTNLAPGPLSPREMELLRSLQQGWSDKQIAAQLGISPGTVKTHLRNIFRKLGARNRVHALALAARRHPAD